jgi:hypothetical protein
LIVAHCQMQFVASRRRVDIEVQAHSLPLQLSDKRPAETRDRVSLPAN